MTESEIMKALECHKERKIDTCSNCPYFDISGCTLELSGDALELLNHKNAEIGRLENLTIETASENAYFHTQIKYANTEIERLEAEAKFIRQYIHDNGLEWDLLTKYKIAKEMGVEL